MIGPVSREEALLIAIRHARVQSLVARRVTEARALKGAGEDAAESRQDAALSAVDAHVRSHENHHLAALGADAAGGAVYDETAGGYAVGGSVKVDLSPVPGDPEATIRKAQRIAAAAMAPANPSAADMRVAARAYALEMAARRDQLEEGDVAG